MTPQRSGQMDGRLWIADARPETDLARKRLCSLCKTSHTWPMKLQLDDVALFTRIAELGTLSATEEEQLESNCRASDHLRNAASWTMDRQGIHLPRVKD